MLRLLRASIVCTALAAGCNAPTTDTGFRGPGSIPDVSGQIEGTILYVGQRPECEPDMDGVLRVKGNVVLLAFLSDNPPPPQGSASSATTLLIVPGREMFSTRDCMPAEPTPEDLGVVVTRSTDFSWPDVPLARDGVVQCNRDNPYRRGGCIDYQVRAFFDRDEDFNPFFSVRRLATRGDVAGGAFVNTAAVPPQFVRLPFGSVTNQPDGQVVSGVAVTLGAIVNTELPASQLGAGTNALSSEDVVPAVADAIMRETMLWEQTHMSLELLDPAAAPWTETLPAAGMSIDPHPSGYAYFVLPVDADRNGEQDLHPILGPAGGVRWEHPIVLLRRARNPIELAVGIPDALIIATVRPTQTLTKDTFDPRVEIVAPPIIAVQTDPNNAACRVPYIAPGNLAETYERIPAECQEVPTGNYDINILAGIAGGRAVNYREQLTTTMPGLPPSVIDSLVRSRTDNDWIIEGGSFSSQAWSIPNELGCPDPYRPTALDPSGNRIAINQIEADPLAVCGDSYPMSCDDDGMLMRCSQGPHGRFAVVDPDPSNAPDASLTTQGRGIAACETAVSGVTFMPRAVAYMDVSEECCAPIAHLCGLPLCALRDEAVLPGAAGARGIRDMNRAGEDYTIAEDGTITPNCVPFLMPASCCD
jgi:hypothetical protein